MPPGTQSPLFAERALFLNRDVGGAAVLGRLVVRLELRAQVVLVTGREGDIRHVTADRHLGRRGPRLAKRVASRASCELFVKAIAESWHDDETFG